MRKIALIGYGGMGQWHARHVKESGDCRILCIYDIDPKAKALAAEHGFHTVDSLRQLLDSEAESCIVATPNDTHLELVTACLESGKHVLVEKPMGMDDRQVEQMYDTAERCGLVLCVHQNRRWDVDYLAMKRLIGENKLGKILNIESRVHGSRGIPGGWRREAQKGGGMLYDWGVHLIDQMLLLYEGDSVESVQCSFTHHTEPSVDDGFYLSMQMASGARGFVEVSTCNFIPLPRFYMTCRMGSAVIEDWRQNGHGIQCLAWTEAEVVQERRGAGTTKTMAPRDEVTVRPFEMPRPQLEPYRLLENFCNAIDGKEALLVTREQMRQVFAVMMAAFRSAENGGTPVMLKNEGVTR